MLLLSTGCPKPASQSPSNTEADHSTPRPSVALRVLIVNEPAMVDAITRLRGEWAERSGGELTASAATWNDLSTAKTLDADVIIFPSRYLGELCTRAWLRPVRGSLLENKDFNSPDIFPLVRNELIKWGGQTMALPLGIDPTTILPSTSEPGSILLLKQAAPHAISNERLGVLFDADTMKPRITEPAFVEALTQLAQADGQSKANDEPAPASGAQHPPVLGNGDRLIAVTTSSHNAASAFKLIEWLAKPDTSSQFARVGNRVLPARLSSASSSAWYEPSLAADKRSDLAKALTAALSGEQCLLIPRIPGIDEYMAALDDAVKAAVVDKLPPQETLHKAAERWEQITTAHGRDQQRDAYQKHLGISDK